MLVWSEWSEWSSSVSLHPTILVDTRRKESLTISFEITLPHAPCFAFTVDAMDAAGNYQNNMQVQQTENGQSNKSNNKNEIKKMRIDSLGRVIGPEGFLNLILFIFYRAEQQSCATTDKSR